MHVADAFRVVGPDTRVQGATDAGHRPGADRVRGLVAGGRPVLVRCVSKAGEGAADARERAEITALISVYAWLGVHVFATDLPDTARQTLAMVASIQGIRPPAVARRGLV
ncbi:MAG: hypothetical protein M0026_06870 [Nocardiopsaceae bacterium]|nr:hypothetical protein [Nocardiopsaceae bacterium]